MARSKKMGNPLAVAAAASKAAPAVKEGATQVNKDTKGALSWVIVGGIAIFGVLILNAINNAGKVGNVVGGAADLASEALKNMIEQLKDPNLNASDSPIGNPGEIIPTISKLTAQNKANALLEAMTNFGTNFERVKGALSNINLADYVLIAESFGTPRYDGFGEGMWPATKRNLSYWIVAELDEEQLSEMRSLLPGLF